MTTVIAEQVDETKPATPPFRLIVAGSRSITDEQFVYSSLDRITRRRKPDVLISGGAPGPDLMGGAWGIANNIHVMWFYPEWSRYGKGAGFQRNWEMAAFAVNEAEGGLLAIWDGQSRGTKHMIDAARRLNLRVRIVRTDEAKA